LVDLSFFSKPLRRIWNPTTLSGLGEKSTISKIAVHALASGATLSLTGCVSHATQSPATPAAFAQRIAGGHAGASLLLG